MGTKLSDTACALVFSSELARHVKNPGRLGLDDLSLTWGEYEVAAGTGGTPVGWGSPWVAVAGLRGWIGDGHLSADEAKSLLGKCQPDRLTELVWKCHLTLRVPRS